MKLSPFTYIFFGICALLFCLSYGWSVMSPNNAEAAARDDNRQKAEDEAAKEGQARKRVEDAKKEVLAEADRWRTIAATKTPNTDVAHGGIEISENGAQLVVDSLQFRNAIQADVNRQIKKGGVKLVGDGPLIPTPTSSPATILADFYNYPAIPFPVVIFDLGTVTVEGTYNQVMTNVRSWSSMPNYLAVADGLRIDGTSPHIQGTYSVSIVGYIRGNKLFTTLPETPGSSAGGAAGAAGAGRGPGASGMNPNKAKFMGGAGGAGGPKPQMAGAAKS